MKGGEQKMMKKKVVKQAMVGLALVVGLHTVPTVSAKTNFTGEYRQGEILSFGSSLTKKEEAALRDYFGVSEDMEAIYVDNAITIEQLGLAPDALANYTGGWYSSAYVKLTDQGGVKVTSNNVSLVTNEMFTNALITSGILNCEVNVSAPFMVTGESALAGILAGAEEIMGERLSEENKVVAKEEIDTTLEIAEEILNNSDNDIDNTADSSNIASGIINDIKQQVIKDSPNSTQIGQIILNVTNNYGVELSEESTARIQRLMEDVNELDIDYKEIKETMNNIGSQISESLKEAGVKLKESGILEKIGDAFANAFKTVWNWVKELFVAIVEHSDEAIENTENLEQVVTENESLEVIDVSAEEQASEENSVIEEEFVAEESVEAETTEEVEVLTSEEDSAVVEELEANDQASDSVEEEVEETEAE